MYLQCVGDGSESNFQTRYNHEAAGGIVHPAINVQNQQFLLQGYIVTLNLPYALLCVTPAMVVLGVGLQQASKFKSC